MQQESSPLKLCTAEPVSGVRTVCCRRARGACSVGVSHQGEHQAQVATHVITERAKGLLLASELLLKLLLAQIPHTCR